MNANSSIRVALFLDSLIQPAWVRQIILDVISLDTAQIAVAILSDRRLKRRNKHQPWLYRIYSSLDKHKFGSGFHAYSIYDLTADLHLCPIVTVSAEEIPHKCNQLLWQYKIDVVLDFSDGIIECDGSAIRYGVWSMLFNSDPPGANEVFQQSPVTPITLIAKTGGTNSPLILSQSSASTHQESVIANCNNVCWRASSLICRELDRLYKERPMLLANRAGFYSDGLIGISKLQFNAKSLFKVAVKIIANRLRYRIFESEWFLAYKFSNGYGHTAIMEPCNFNCLYPPTGRFWADPFPVFWESKYYVFLEDASYVPRKGRISVIELNLDGTYSNPEVVIERDYHMSYPFVFRCEGDFYMVPETYANNRIELYRCTEFPHRWELCETLIKDVKAVDATLLNTEGRWWMFVNIQSDRSSVNDELFLFHASNPIGPWKPHRHNPIVSDARCARSAGKIYCLGGKLFRPAQDCSGGIYGRAIRIQEIVRLDEQDYEERFVAEIGPNWHKGLFATHTLNSDAGLTLIDGCRYIRKRGS